MRFEVHNVICIVKTVTPEIAGGDSPDPLSGERSKDDWGQMAGVGVVGLGKLGLPMAALYAQVGHRVMGIDKSSALIRSLRNGHYFSTEPGLCELAGAVENNIKYFDDFTRVAECEYIFIIVPTPSDESGAFSNEYVEDALGEIVKSLDGTELAHRIVVSSTVMPGSCDQFVKDYIEPFNKKNNKGKLSLIYSPEFIALGSVLKDLQHPDLILIGSEDSELRDTALPLLGSILSPRAAPGVPECTLVEAELAKLAINNYLSIKTAFANSIGELATSLGADPLAVLSVVGSDSRIGTKFLRPGMTASGPCIPRDTVALRKLSWDQNVPPFLSRSAEMVHERRRSYLLTMADHSGGPYAVVGLSYKPNTVVFDASLTVWLAEKLISFATQPVKVWDPSLVCPEGLEKNWKLTLFDTLDGAKTIIMGDVDSSISKQVMEYYEENKDVRIVDCWRS